MAKLGLPHRLVRSAKKRVTALKNFVRYNISETGKHTQQISNWTVRGKHSTTFKNIKDMVGERPLRILSFGCSFGDECLDLAEVFMGSKIYGCDIDENALSVAREKCGPDIDIFNYSEFDSYEPFNLVTVMSVLCRFPQTKEKTCINRIYPFSKFNTMLCRIDSKVAPHGFMVIYNSNYFFEDSEIALKYEKCDPIFPYSTGFVEKALPSGMRAAERTLHIGERKLRGEEYWGFLDKYTGSELPPAVLNFEYKWYDASEADSRSFKHILWQKK